MIPCPPMSRVHVPVIGIEAPSGASCWIRKEDVMPIRLSVTKQFFIPLVFSPRSPSPSLYLIVIVTASVYSATEPGVIAVTSIEGIASNSILSFLQEQQRKKTKRNKRRLLYIEGKIGFVIVGRIVTRKFSIVGVVTIIHIYSEINSSAHRPIYRW